MIGGHGRKKVIDDRTFQNEKRRDGKVLTIHMTAAGESIFKDGGSCREGYPQEPVPNSMSKDHTFTILLSYER